MNAGSGLRERVPVRPPREPGVAHMLALVMLQWAGVNALAYVLGLSAELGTLVAGLAVAATFIPMIARENRLLATRERASGADRAGDDDSGRRHAAVAFAGIAGFAALARRDERTARLAGTLLHGAARALCEDRGLRVLPSMGDAVMLEGPDAYGMAEALLELHVTFPALSRAHGLPPLSLQTGVHQGEVVEAPDGSLGGPGAILASRLQSHAAGGQVACSLAFARAAGLGPGRLRRHGSLACQPGDPPVACYSLIGTPRDATAA